MQTIHSKTVAVEQKHNREGGAGARGCEEADYLREASACEGQKLEGLKPSPPCSATLAARHPWDDAKVLEQESDLDSRKHCSQEKNLDPGLHMNPV